MSNDILLQWEAQSEHHYSCEVVADLELNVRYFNDDNPTDEWYWSIEDCYGPPRMEGFAPDRNAAMIAAIQAACEFLAVIARALSVLKDSSTQPRAQHEGAGDE